MKKRISPNVFAVARTMCLIALVLIGGGVFLLGFMNAYVAPTAALDAVLTKKELANVPLRNAVMRALDSSAKPLWEPWMAVGFPVFVVGAFGLMADMVWRSAVRREEEARSDHA